MGRKKKNEVIDDGSVTNKLAMPAVDGDLSNMSSEEIEALKNKRETIEHNEFLNDNKKALELIVKENKAQHIARIAKEDAERKESNKEVDQWIEIHGQKVIRKIKKKFGSVYSLYLGKKKDCKIFLKNCESDGVKVINK